MQAKKVIHAELEKAGPGKLKVICPDCGHGHLTMRRHFVTLRLLNWDICPSCSQKFIFEDINKLIKEESDGKEKETKRRRYRCPP
jgi:hypothetical protein